MAQTTNIKDLMEKERDRLTTRKGELDAELAAITDELNRVNAYLGTTPRPTPRKPTGDRAERGSVQEQVKAAVLSSPQGITTSQLNQRLEGMSPQSIQNALGAAVKWPRIFLKA